MSLTMNPAEHKDAHPWEHRIHQAGLVSAIALGGIVLAPYLLPAFGIGSTALAAESMAALHATETGTGLAGLINSAIAAIPGVGASMAGGGYGSALWAAGLGIGGAFLGRYLEKQEDGSNKTNWGRIIREATLATSILIALPALLTGISSSMVFLAATIGGATLATSAVGFFSGTLGSLAIPSAAAGISGLLPHFLTCGVSILPAAIGWKATAKKGSTVEAFPEATTLQPKLAESATARLMAERNAVSLPAHAHAR